MNVLKEELVGPNPYDRRYTIDPHADCTGEGCGDVAVLEFQQGQWTIKARSVVTVTE